MENQTKTTNEVKNITRHMYQDGNDLVVVYANVFNNDYNLENMIREEILKQPFMAGRSYTTDTTPLLEPMETVEVPAPTMIRFGYIHPEKFGKFKELGGKSQKENGGTCNYVTSEALAQKIEAELGITRLK